MLENIYPHLPVLQVVIPLIAAPIAMMIMRPNAAWGFALVVSWVAFAISCLLLAQVLDQGVIIYLLGDWQPPWGITYYIDAANALVLLIVSGIGALVMTYAREGVMAEIDEANKARFYSVFLLALAGLLGVTITGDAFNVFVFLEILSRFAPSATKP